MTTTGDPDPLMPDLYLDKGALTNSGFVIYSVGGQRSADAVLT